MDIVAPGHGPFVNPLPFFLKKKKLDLKAPSPVMHTVHSPRFK